MKTLIVVFISLVAFASPAQQQDSITVEATFVQGQEGTYYFSFEDREPMEFKFQGATAVAKYNLDSGAYEGKLFRITYTTQTVVDDEEGEEYDQFVITDLELKE